MIRARWRYFADSHLKFSSFFMVYGCRFSRICMKIWKREINWILHAFRNYRTTGNDIFNACSYTSFDTVRFERMERNGQNSCAHGLQFEIITFANSHISLSFNMGLLHELSHTANTSIRAPRSIKSYARLHHTLLCSNGICTIARVRACGCVFCARFESRKISCIFYTCNILRGRKTNLLT